MTIDINTSIPLNDGRRIPALGLGVFRSPAGETTRNAVLHALQAGYRHIDTARIYGNERDVGAAVRDSGIAREDVYVTTKLWNDDHGYDAALRAFDASLERLGLDYVDLYLVHWPVAEKRLDTWRALEKLRSDGRCRSIGVSNYLTRHLRELLDQCTCPPAVNQIELSPFNYLYRHDTLELCREYTIAVEAYSPLTKGRKLDDPRLAAIAARYARTPAQVLLRWVLQHGYIVLPKSVNPGRIRENAEVFGFSLSQEDMDALDAWNENLATGWDPADAP